VVQAEDGAAAVHAAGHFHPDIVLCDIGLPDMDGYAVAQAIRANPLLDGVYLVDLTGYGRAEDRARALAAGFDEHLAKPVAYDQLVDLLRTRELHAVYHSSD
jgi:CheY-like chemotaxis protein